MPRTTRSKLTGPLAAGSSHNLDKLTAATSSKPDLALTKRKREALGEVTNKNKAPLRSDGKGLAVEKSSIAIKKGGPTTLTSVTGARVPLGERRITGSNTNKAAAGTFRKAKSASVEKEEENKNIPDVDAMPVEPAVRASRRISTRTSTTTTNQHATTGIVRASTSTTLASRRTVVTAHSSVANVAGHARGRSIPGRRPLTSTQSRQAEIEDDVEKPAQKKRRTSSVGPEEGHQEAKDVPVSRKSRVLEQEEQVDEELIEEPEHEGLGSLEGEQGWEDLDKEDAGDPLMASEYVNEIFQYLIKLEVRLPLSTVRRLIADVLR